MLDEQTVAAIVDTVVAELSLMGQALPSTPSGANVPEQTPGTNHAQPALATAIEARLQAGHSPAVPGAFDPDGLAALMETTTARIGVGRAGPRPRTADLLTFQADLAVTKDTLNRVVDPALLAEFGLFSVRTMVVGGTEEYLRRPDLGRRLSDEAKATIASRCARNPDIQLCVGDGLSARAIEANLRKVFPVIRDGCATAGFSMGTPFFIERCRVGVMNDIGDLVDPKVLILLIGERPGLGRAESMSAYMGYRPHAGLSDADRDVICNIFDGGGVNPLEAGAYALRLARTMIDAQASGIRLRLAGEKS